MCLIETHFQNQVLINSSIWLKMENFTHYICAVSYLLTLRKNSLMSNCGIRCEGSVIMLTTSNFWSSLCTYRKMLYMQAAHWVFGREQLHFPTWLVCQKPFLEGKTQNLVLPYTV